MAMAVEMAMAMANKTGASLMKLLQMTRAWVITQCGDDGIATAVRKTSTYYANLDAALAAHGHNFIKWSDDTIEIDVPSEDVVTEPF